jgi:hypothetical protein
MKSFIKLICLTAIPFLITSCADDKNTPAGNSAISIDQPDDLKVGGLYLFQNKDNTYYLTKILVLDDFAVHLRTYNTAFKTKPADVSSDSLTILIDHAPLDKNGFLLDKPELLKVEEVKESELEGYKMYVEAMNK